MAEAKKIGEMLKEAGFIDEFQLQSALSHQRNWGGKLGHVLIELEFVREEELARVIAEKLKIPYVSLFEPGVPETVINLVKPEFARKYNVVPAAKDKGVLTLAMADPMDIEAIDAIRFATGLNIKPSLALESEIRDAIRKYYDGEEIVRKEPKVPFHQRTHSTEGKMEIIRGSDLSMPKPEAGSAQSSRLSREESVTQALQEGRMRLDALSTLLIEKGLITREELVSMIYQKKMGL
jgi:type IV pilus assembly protein PilB